MKILCRSLIVAIVLMLPLTSKSDEKLESLKSIYAGEMDKIVAQHSTDMEAVNKAYLGYLDAELKKATDKGDLSGYKKTEAEKTRFQKENTIPANTTVQGFVDQTELRKNAAVISLSKKYLAGLNSHKIALMKAKDIGGASAVQDEVKKIEAVVQDMNSRLPAKTPGGSATAAVENAGPVKLTAEQKKGLVLWYDFEDVGDRITDKSGKGNNGRRMGAKKVQDGQGKGDAAFEFSKSDEMIVSSQEIGISGSQERSVAFWVKVNELSDLPIQRLVGWSEGKGNGTVFRISTDHNNWMLYAYRIGWDVNTGIAVDSSQWVHHIVVHINGKIYWYINGVQSVSRDIKGLATRDTVVTVGGSANKMMIDDVMIWDRALSEDEAKQVYEATGGK